MTASTVHPVDERLPTGRLAALGFQHVLVMYAGAIAVPLIVMSGMSLDRVRATATADLGFESDLLYAAPLKLEAAANESAGFRIRSVRDNLEKASGCCIRNCG